MTKNGNVTLKDVYEAINALENRVMHRVEKIEENVEENTTFRNQLIGKMTALFVILGIGINALWDLFINRK